MVFSRDIVQDLSAQRAGDLWGNLRFLTRPPNYFWPINWSLKNFFFHISPLYKRLFNYHARYILGTAVNYHSCLVIGAFESQVIKLINYFFSWTCNLKNQPKSGQLLSFLEMVSYHLIPDNYNLLNCPRFNFPYSIIFPLILKFDC